jgi:probable HAF family extracellular repeat protein
MMSLRRATRTARLAILVLPLVALLTLSQEVRAQSAAPQYSVIKLAPFPFWPGAITSSGNVVGYGYVGGNAHVFFWSNGVMTDLGTMGGSQAVSQGLNDAGQITGEVLTSHGIDTYIYTNGSVLDLGQPTNNYYGIGINNRGDVASNTGGGTPYLYANGVIQDLNMGGCSGEIGIDVNDSDVVLGDGGGGPCGHQSSVVWSGGNFQILPSTTGAWFTQPAKINAGGQIAGWAGFTTAPSAHPVVWQPDNAGGWTLVDLGVPAGVDGAYAFGINNLGVVVGEMDSALYGNHGHGFVWDPTHGIQDLNSLIAPGSGMVLGNAQAINNSGQIVGFFSDGTAYLLTPVHTTLSMGPQAMEGNLTLSAGDTLQAGYDFTMPGSHPAATVSFIGATVTFAWTCVSGPGSGILVVPLANQSYTDAQGSPDWYPSGEQNSPLVYQGSVAVPNGCNGGPVSFREGGTFSTGISSTDTTNKINVRWHYSGGGSAGGWSGTKSVVP